MQTSNWFGNRRVFSTGKASYEISDNSGIGSNGLTSVEDMNPLNKTYMEHYPETCKSQNGSRAFVLWSSYASRYIA